MLGGPDGLLGDVQDGVDGDAPFAGMHESFAGNLQDHAVIRASIPVGCSWRGHGGLLLAASQ